MGVAAQVVEDFLGRRERAFGIDYPWLLAQGANQVSKSSGCDERSRAAMELQLFFGASLLDEPKELTAKDETERFDREEEGLASRYPLRAIEGQCSTGNEAIGDNLHVVANHVRQGGSLASAIAEQSMFPHVAIEMIEVGESTGALADMLNSVADFYDEENEVSLTRFSNLIQPVLLIVMGLVIAGLLLSLYMPLFQLSTLTQ